LGYFGDLGGTWRWPETNGNWFWEPRELWIRLIGKIRECPQHQFITLTKDPTGIPEYVAQNWPDNLWMGTSVTGIADRGGDYTMPYERDRAQSLMALAPRERRFLSIEPMLGSAGWVRPLDYAWVIMGGLTGKRAKPAPWPEIDWVITGCQRGGVPVYVKGNAQMRDGAPREYPEGLILPWERDDG